MLESKQKSVKLVNEIRQICKPLFDKTSINYFEYARQYLDGRTLILSTDTEYINFFKTHDAYLNTPPPIISPGQHLWQSYIDLEFVAEVKNFFNLDNGITVIQKNGAYNEIINFASIANDRSILSLYLNQFEILEHFIKYFIDKANRIIDNEIKKPTNVIQIPTIDGTEAESLKIELLKTFNAKKINIKVEDRWVALTKREVQCLTFLLEGCSAKQIARELNISFRTVEIHCNNIREKTSCSTRLELLGKVENKHLIRHLAFD